MNTDQVARFHVHVCPVCGARTGCTSAACDRRSAELAHESHEAPEPARVVLRSEDRNGRSLIVADVARFDS